MNIKKPYVGTELKFLVTMTATGFSMDTDNWSVTVTRGRISKTFPKTDCIRGTDGWYLCFDSAEFGPGQYYATLTAYVPDNDFPDGMRTEVTKVPLPPVEP